MKWYCSCVPSPLSLFGPFIQQLGLDEICQAGLACGSRSTSLYEWNFWRFIPARMNEESTSRIRRGEGAIEGHVSQTGHWWEKTLAKTNSGILKHFMLSSKWFCGKFASSKKFNPFHIQFIQKPSMARHHCQFALRGDLKQPAQGSPCTFRQKAIQHFTTPNCTQNCNENMSVQTLVTLLRKFTPNPKYCLSRELVVEFPMGHVPTTAPGVSKTKWARWNHRLCKITTHSPYPIDPLQEIMAWEGLL